jgi:dTDP-4-amino-4,6-dideoxygalactose transaminase
MLVSSNAEWVRAARHLATQAREPVLHYEHTKIGYNYRLSNLLAAVGRGQLRHLDDRLARRRAHREAYREAFRGLPGLEFMPEAPYGRSNGWLTCLTVDPAAFGHSRDEIIARLAEQNAEARPTWKPMHLQPVFSNCRTRGGGVSAAIFERGLCLPSGSGMTPAQRERVIGTVRGLGR